MLISDLHIHTIASGHAYSTLLESVDFARAAGMETIAITDHGPSMIGAPHTGYFNNMSRVPKIIKGINVLAGCEANVVDLDGNIDLEKNVVDGLDVVLVGLHKFTPYPGHSTSADNTKALIGAMVKNKIHIIAHPFRLDFPVDVVELIKVAADQGVLMELNLSVLRLFGKDKFLHGQYSLMIETAERLGVRVVVSSDAHFVTEIGDDAILTELGIVLPKALVLGSSNGYNEIVSALESRV